MVEEVEKKRKAKKSGRQYTVSIALPGSILSNAQSFELKTCLAGQIARACAIFSIDEIVVFDEDCQLPLADDGSVDEDAAINDLCSSRENSSALLSYLLQYAECPQYLRKYLFPFSKALGKAGLMSPLMTPHHLLKDELCRYREGVVQSQSEGHSLVDVGLMSPVTVDRLLPEGVRVTVNMGKQQHFGNNHESTKKKKKRKVDKIKTLASPQDPRCLRGLYWGYSVRLANGLSQVFSGTSLSSDGSYDLIIGTSERGESVDVYSVPSFRHLLIVFGGVQGLEHSLSLDKSLCKKHESPAELCSVYLNTCPKQGSKTIRTEEAVLVTMSALRSKIQSVHHSAITTSST